MDHERTNEELISLIRNENEKYLDVLIAQNMAMINGMIKKLSVHNELSEFDKEELRQIGRIAIMESAKKYDEKMGTKFITLAGVTIKFRMLTWLNENREMIHIPVKIKDKCATLQKITREFYERYGHMPSNDYVKKEMKIIEMDLYAFRDIINRMDVGSIDTEINDEGRTITIADTIRDKKDLVNEYLKKEEKGILISKVMQLKDERERQVILGEYFRGERQIDIAKRLGVSKQQITKIKIRAFEHLRKLPEIRDIGKSHGMRVAR